MAGDVAFSQWLKNYLLDINPETDADIFVEYIQSLLDESEDDEELLESLKEILSPIVDEDRSEEVCEKIQSQYTAHRSESEQKKAASVIAPEEQLKLLIEEEKQRSVDPTGPPVVKPSSPRDRTAFRYRADDDIDDDDDDDDECSGVAQNVNRSSVDSKERARRAAMKQDSQRKKEKDKLDREKQAEKAKSRKEAEKQRTQKRERRGR